MSEDLKNTRAHCSNCSGERNHVVLHSVYRQWVDGEQDQHRGSDTYATLRCAGCDTIRFRHETTSPWEPFESTEYYPRAVFRRQPEWFFGLNSDFRFITSQPAIMLDEIYAAVQHDLLRFAAMGVRALLELIMVEQVGDVGTFKQNLAAFEKAGFVSCVQAERLGAILEAGHATIHRGYVPSRGDVVVLLDITEHLIETIYIHGDQVKALAGRVPPKPPRKPSEKG